ncbi:Uncharacterised protein [uncultured archaeon]|nr:Uncharacterised protein [uncultured archaeon]
MNLNRQPDTPSSTRGNIFVDGFHLSEVIKRSGVTKNHRVLDIATGVGFLALEFAKTVDIDIGFIPVR